MPSPLLLHSLSVPHGSLVVLTGASGFIGSHIADQLLAAGFKVRGTTRNASKNQWAVDFFARRHGNGRFQLVEVADLKKEDAFEDAVKDAQGFIHTAHEMGGSDDPSITIPYAVDMAMNALKAAHKAGIKRFVYTSSSFAVTQPKPDLEFTVYEDTFNEDAVSAVDRLGKGAGGETSYAASKVAVERAFAKWKKESGADLVINCVNPNGNIGPPLCPKEQGYPTTAGWVKHLWDGNYEKMEGKKKPEHYINVVDDAKLHVIALVHTELKERRLIGMAGPSPISRIVEILKEAYPEREWKEFVDEGKDKCTNAEREKVEKLLIEAYGHGYVSLEDSVRESARVIASEA